MLRVLLGLRMQTQSWVWPVVMSPVRCLRVVLHQQRVSFCFPPCLPSCAPRSYATPQVQDSLHVEQWVQVLGCFGSLGVQQQVPGGPALLLTTLQHVLEGLPNLQAK